LGDDGVPGTGSTPDQDFALVVSNATQQAAPVLAHAATTVSGGDGDGVLESDEQVGLTEQLRNAGDANATSLSSTLTGSSALGISQGSSTYPTIGAGDGVSANSTQFIAHLANAATCGADVSATLSIATNAGTQTVPLVLPTGAPGALQRNTSSAVSKAIPDDSATGASSSLFIAERGRIKDLNVTLPSPGIVHPSDGDLVIDLIGPDGTTVRLADHVRGPDYAGDNFSGTTFDDEAVQNISQGNAPFTGNFRPQQDQLSRFDGKNRRGTWTLRVRDLFAGDVGTLRAWGIASQKASCNVDRSAPDTVIGAGPPNPTTSTSATFSIGSADETAIFECRLDSTAWAPCGRTVAYSGLALGAHSFAARAIDGSDNEDASPATYEWKVTQPAASFVLAPTEERLSTAAAGHYRALAACASACRASAKLTARVGRRTITLGSGAKRRAKAGTATVAVAMGKRGRGVLRGRELMKAKLTVTLTQGSSKLTLKRTVSLRHGAGLRRIADRGLKLWTVAARSSRLTGTLSLSRAQARRLDLKVGKRKRMTIARRSTTAGRTPNVLTLRLSHAARRAFSHARRVGTLLEAVAGEAPEPLRTAKLSKTLVR
jgi:subtilisin-like proprotein convertase family protein